VNISGQTKKSSPQGEFGADFVDIEYSSCYDFTSFPNKGINNDKTIHTARNGSYLGRPKQIPKMA
jgi:hypothetical protein